MLLGQSKTTSQQISWEFDSIYFLYKIHKID